MLKVLIATDGSRGAGHSVDLAQQLLAGKEVEVTLLHVIPRHLILDPRAGPVVAETLDQAQVARAAQTTLDRCAQQLQEGGVGGTIRKEVEVGDPAEVILTLAEQQQVDLIALGSHGSSVVQRFMRGSVATKVATHARCAVLIGHHQTDKTETSTVEDQAGGHSAS